MLGNIIIVLAAAFFIRRVIARKRRSATTGAAASTGAAALRSPLMGNGGVGVPAGMPPFARTADNVELAAGNLHISRLGGSGGVGRLPRGIF